MARLSYRRYRKPLRGSSAPLSVSFTPVDSFASQVKMWNEQLTLARDKEALQALADGHSDSFLVYATTRAKDATGDDKLYWQGLLDNAREKIAEDTLVAQVSSGEKKLEDLQAYLQGILKTAGEGERPGIIGSLAKIKNGIEARDFNKEIGDAQASYLESSDSEAYLTKLSGMLSRAIDPKAQQALAGQVKTLRTEIVKKVETKRYAEANGKIVGYYDGSVPRAEMLRYLNEMATSSASPEEANRYATLAGQIDTRERTLERQALSDALRGARSGSASGSKTFKEVIDGYKRDYDTANTDLQVAIRNAANGRATIPTSVINAYMTEANRSESAMRSNFVNAPTSAILDTMSTFANNIKADRAERELQISSALTSGVLKKVDDLRDQAKDNSDDPNSASQYRYLATQEIRTALQDPLVAKFDTNRSLETKLRVVVSEQQAAVKKQAAIVAGTSVNKYRPVAQSVFNSYQDFLATNAGKYVDQTGTVYTPDLVNGKLKLRSTKDQLLVRKPPIGDYQNFLDVAKDGEANVQDVLVSLGIGGAPNVESTVQKWLVDLRQARQVDDQAVSEARLRLESLVAPRDNAGFVIPDIAAGPSEWTGGITPPSGQAFRGGFRSGDYGANAQGTPFAPFDDRGLVSPPTDLGPAGAMPPLSVATNPQNGADTSFYEIGDSGGGAGAPAPFTPPPAAPSGGGFPDIGGFLGGVAGGVGGALGAAGNMFGGLLDRGGLFGASEGLGDPFSAAHAWLDQPAQIDVPNYEIPDLPESSAFAPAPYGGNPDRDMFMPTAPTTAAQREAAPAIA